MKNPLLTETQFLDFNSAEVAEFVAKHAGTGDQKDRAVRLFYAVRDRIHYEIYNADLSASGMRASAILSRGSGLCIHKSVVYAATLRRIGIPARLWFTDVQNHLCSERLAQIMGGRVFHYHCLVSLKLGDRWLRATPVFNRRLCQLYRMTPLDFDGESDCVHHPFDESGQKNMEILKDHGEFDDLPHGMILAGLRRTHGALFASPTRFRAGSLARDATIAALAS
jgi:transglutaminase-like putative cysteine protease